jgi:subtilase family serine protease
MRLMKAFPLSVLAGALLCSAALLCGPALPAQNSSVAPRITTDVNELSLATLKGNVPHLARAEFDQGEAAPSTPLTHIRLVLSRSAEQQAALDSYLAQLQDKSSPNYHKWLTPEQFGQLYGPADSDIAALVAWLESHGLQVETVSKGRTNIAFNGTVSQVEEAFHTSIHSFQAGDRQFTSNTTDPQIPSALANVVMGVAHLNTIRPRPHSHLASVGHFNPESKRLEPADTLSANGARPYLTSGSGTTNSPYVLYMVPGDAATIYDTPNSFNANFAGGTSYTGAGVKIGLGGDATINASIVAAYRSMFLGNSTQPILNYCTTSSSCSSTPGSGYIADDADEAYLDTELSGGLAPGATIYYYASSDLYTGLEAAIDQNLVDIFSLSFGECEQDNESGSGDNAQINSLWKQAATAGIAVMVSAGDSGSAGCDYPSTNSGANVPDATGGLAVSGYASTPYNIAVGGTDFYLLWTSNAEFETYVNISNEGSSSNNYNYYRTAKSYIPESTWNDSSYYDTTISEDEPLSAAGYKSSYNNIVAGSGGASTIYPKPSWQTGTGVPSDSARDLPDVSLMSGNGFDDATWVVCTADKDGAYTTDCETQSNNEFYFSGFGGTSTASPAFAGILALVQQKTQSRLGMPATVLYGLFNGSHSSSIFHDVTVGNNSVPCTSAPDSSCVKNAAGYYFESGYNTTTGYDLATGMGSVDATQLVNYWNSSTGSTAATVTFTSVSPNPATTVVSVNVVISVSGASGTPTGTITLTGGSYNSGAVTIGSGTCTSASNCAFTIPIGDLPIGTDTLTVTYSGNSTYAVATNSATVTVNGLTASVSITSPAFGAGINSNQQLPVSGAVACTGTCAGGTPTGTVTLTGGGYTSAATALSSGGYSIIIPYNSLSAGTDILTVTYNGSAIYSAGATGTTSVTVTYVAVSTPTVTVAPASGSIDSSQTYSVTVTVAGSGATPTGTVTLSSGSYISAAQTIATTGSCTASSCAITIPANSLSNGTDTITATYSGDANYASNTGTATVTVTKSAFALQATNIASLAPGATTGNTSTITVSSATFYSGTITLTCALTSGPTNASGDTPYCSGGSNTLTLSSGVVTGTASATITVTTTAASAALVYPNLPGKGRGLFGAGGGAVLAFLVFLGIPARRRSWRSMLGILIVMTALGSMAACGGSGGGSTNPTNPGTTAGTYTFTVTGTGNDPAKTTVSIPFTVTVT